MTKMSGRPGTVRSGSTTTRPLRSSGTARNVPIPEAATPAAQRTVAASTRSPAPMTIPVASTAVTAAPVRTSTPRRTSSDRAFSEEAAE